jgi:hypothetical protein
LAFSASLKNIEAPILTSPSVAQDQPVYNKHRVDFPAPLGPRKPYICPFFYGEAQIIHSYVTAVAF